MCKVENVPDKLSDLPKAISEQNVKGTTWLLHAIYNKMREERDKLRERLSKKRSQDLYGF